MKIVAHTRSDKGTGHSRRLRRSGVTPGVLYGGGADAQLINIEHKELFFSLQKETFHSSLLDMEIDGKKQLVLLRDFQMHAFKPLVLHADYQRVDLKKKITVKVPLHFINQENSPAVKLSKGIVSHVTNELEISCLPKDLPDNIVIDLSDLKVDAPLHLSNITLPKGVTAVSNRDLTLVTVSVAGEKETLEESAPPAAESAPAADNKTKK